MWLPKAINVEMCAYQSKKTPNKSSFSLQASEAGGAPVLLLAEAPPLLPGSGHPLLPAPALGAHHHLPVQATDRTGGPPHKLGLLSLVTTKGNLQEGM